MTKNQLIEKNKFLKSELSEMSEALRDLKKLALMPDKPEETTVQIRVARTADELEEMMQRIRKAKESGVEVISSEKYEVAIGDAKEMAEAGLYRLAFEKLHGKYDELLNLAFN